jgi:hypothetical protein
MSDKVYVHNNGENPIAIPFTVGDRNRELRFHIGWNEIDPGPLERVTGGFDERGFAKGGLGAVYFNEPIRIGKKHLPRLELGTPRPSDTVHACPDVPGIRRHYRTLKAEKQEQEHRALLALLEQTTRELARAKSGDDGLVEVDLGNGIKARMSLADAKKFAASQSPDAVPTAAQPAVVAPFDPGTMTVTDLTSGDVLEGLGADQLRALIAAEESGKNRVGALAELREALEIVEA